MADRGRNVLGFLKVGVRDLLLWDPKGEYEKKRFCLLEIFRYLNCQRQGYGKRMIDAILEDEQLQASFEMKPSTLSGF
jgi:hypothetical protein